MEVPKGNLVASTLMEVDMGDSIQSLQKFLEMQKDLFHNQVDNLEKIVVTQCKLTGVNPLSQEMAAGALSINIGKRPRDLLNPKAVKYMQSVFSIKDTLSKKETREISALCGVTLTQVREFFTGQRSRVRKLVRLSREKAMKSNAIVTFQDGCSNSSDYDMSVINPVPLNSMGPKAAEESPSSSVQEETIPGIDDFDKNFIANIFNLMRKEVTFAGEMKLMEWIMQIENASVLYWFVTKGGLMILAAWLSQAAAEEQTTVLLVVLKVLCHLPLHKALPTQMSAILQSVNRLRFYRTSDISNRAKVLLSRWSKLFIKSQALKKQNLSNSPIDAQNGKNPNQSGILSIEWQSSIDLPEDILSLALENTETCRNSQPSLPLKLLQSSPDDSNRKHGSGVSSLKTRERRKVMPMEQPGRDTNDRSPQVTRVVPSNQARPMSADDIQKAKMRAMFMKSKYEKNGGSPNGNQKQKTEVSNKSLNPQSTNLRSILKHPIKSKLEDDKKPAILSNTSSTPPRPKSEEDEKPAILSITCTSPPRPEIEVEMKPAICSKTSTTPSRFKTEEDKEPTILSITSTTPTSKAEEGKKPDIISNTYATPPKAPMVSMPRLSPQKSLLEKLKSNQIPWHSPPEIKIDSLWSVGEGENSKEVEIQARRMQREKEIVYQREQNIPPNPKEPWDMEMDFDDSLTPVIPVEQSVDAESTEAPSPLSSPRLVTNPLQATVTATTSALAPAPVPVPIAPTPPAPIATTNAPEPDLELLAVLLKNPELVFALTSGQGNNLTSEDTIKLLDTIKRNGVGLSGVLNGLERNTNKEEVVATSLPSPTPVRSLPSPTPTRSFPSPTPPTDRLMNGWRTEVAVNSFSQHPVSATKTESYGLPQATPSIQFQEQHSGTVSMPPQRQTSNFSGQLSVEPNVSPLQQLPFLQQNGPSGMNTHSSFSHGLQPSVSERQFPMSQPMNQFPNQIQPPINPFQHNNPSVSQPSMQPELASYGHMQGFKPASVTITMNKPNSMQHPSQTSLVPEPSLRHLHPTMQWNSVGTSRQTQMAESWSHGNENNYHGGPLQPQLRENNYHGGLVQQQQQRAGPSWERNDYVVGEPEFESWSPERQPVNSSRSPQYYHARNYTEPRRDFGRGSTRPDWSRRSRDIDRRYHRPYGNNSNNRRWRDHDRGR